MDRYEAIERIKARFDKWALDNEDMKAIQTLIPELRESEDERIRKFLCHTFTAQYLCKDKTGKWHGEPVTNILAYLEKQKEQPTSAIDVLARAGLKPYKDGNQWCILAGDNIQEGVCGFGDTIDEALYQFLMDVLEQKKEQEQPVEDCHELEKEIDDWYNTMGVPVTNDALRDTARHFAEWGASHAVAPHYFELRELKTGRVFLAEWSDIAGEWYERGNGKAYQSDEVEIVQHAKK